MCGLCGVLAGSDHWADASAAPGGGTRSAMRQLRARIANQVLAHYRLKLSEAGGTFVLRSATGKTSLVLHLGALWPAAERLSGKPCDPLDPQFIAELKRERLEEP